MADTKDGLQDQYQYKRGMSMDADQQKEIGNILGDMLDSALKGFFRRLVEAAQSGNLSQEQLLFRLDESLVRKLASISPEEGLGEFLACYSVMKYSISLLPIRTALTQARDSEFITGKASDGKTIAISVGGHWSC